MTTAINEQLPLVNYSFSELPLDVWGRIMHICPVASLEKLMRTCHFLYLGAFEAIAKGYPYRGELCSKIVKRFDQETLRKFLAACAETKAIIKTPVNIYLPYKQEVQKSLEMIQSSFPIESLILDGNGYNSKNVSECLRACPDLKGLNFQNCHQIDFSEIGPALFQNIENLFFSRVTFVTFNNEDQELSTIANWCKNLKRFGCIQCSNFDPDFHCFSLKNDLFESFIEHNWDADDLEDGWEKLLMDSFGEEQEEIFRKSQTTSALSTYYFACERLKVRDYSKAEILFLESIQKAPRFINPKIAFAWMLFEDKDFMLSPEKQKEAERLLRESLDIFPNHMRAQVRLGLLLLATKRDQEGYACLEKAFPRALARQDIDSLLEIAQALGEKFPNKRDGILNHVFWSLAAASSFTSIDYKSEKNSDILDIDKTHLLALLQFENWPLSNEEYPMEAFEKRESMFLERKDFPSLLTMAFCRKKSELLEPIKAAILPEYLQAAEGALQKLMEDFLDISSWINLLQALHKSKKDIIPCLSLLAFFTARRDISRVNFALVSAAFRSSHYDWFLKSLPAIVAYKRTIR
jgi:hypothetical protein